MVKVFISWSKDLSRAFAEAFREWIPNVLQTVEPFMSSQDIALGQRGIVEIEQRLDTISFGVLFVTEANHREPWLLYEAGALSRSVANADTRVIPILLDIGRERLAGSPLSHFQNADTASKKTFCKVCMEINGFSKMPLPEDRLVASFEKWWPDLENRFQSVDVPNSSSEPATFESLSHEVSALAREIVDLRNNEARQSEYVLDVLEAVGRRLGAIPVKPIFGSSVDLDSSLTSGFGPPSSPRTMFGGASRSRDFKYKDDLKE